MVVGKAKDTSEMKMAENDQDGDVELFNVEAIRDCKLNRKVCFFY